MQDIVSTRKIEQEGASPGTDRSLSALDPAAQAGLLESALETAQRDMRKVGQNMLPEHEAKLEDAIHRLRHGESVRIDPAPFTLVPFDDPLRPEYQPILDAINAINAQSASPAADAAMLSPDRAGALDISTEQVLDLIARAKAGDGAQIHSGGESAIFRVGDHVVKLFHDFDGSGPAERHVIELGVIAAAINSVRENSLNVHVSALPASEIGNALVSEFQPGPKLRDLFLYARANQDKAPSERSIEQLEPGSARAVALQSFLDSHPDFRCADFVKQTASLMQRMGRVDSSDLGVEFIANEDHLIVKDVLASTDPYIHQRVELLLMDAK